MTRPLASRECWCSPRNMRPRTPLSPDVGPSHPSGENPPLSTTTRHPNATIHHPSTHSAPLLPPGPRSPRPARHREAPASRTPVVDHLGMRPVDPDDRCCDAYESTRAATVTGADRQPPRCLVGDGPRIGCRSTSPPGCSPTRGPSRRDPPRSAGHPRASADRGRDAAQPDLTVRRRPPTGPRRPACGREATSRRLGRKVKRQRRRDRSARNVLLGLAPAARTVSRRRAAPRQRPLAAQAGTASARPRYCCQTGSIGPADAISDVVACGATGGRRSTMPHSRGSRSSLRALHDRHDATTFSHVCGPPRERGTTWSRFSAVAPAVLAAVPVAREHGPPRERRRRAERHPHEVHEPDHRRDRDAAALGAELGAVAVDDLGLLLEHEHDRAPGRHDAERLEAGVEQERSGHGGPTSRAAECTGAAPVADSVRTAAGADSAGAAPLEIARRRRPPRAVRRAVRRLEPEPRGTAAVGQREKRWPPPPPSGDTARKTGGRAVHHRCGRHSTAPTAMEPNMRRGVDRRRPGCASCASTVAWRRRRAGR